MTVNQVQLLAASFEDSTKADVCLTVLKQMEKDGTIDILDAAVLSKQEDGKLKIEDVRELTPKKGRRRGAVIGGIFGIIFPPSILLSAVAGGVLGGLFGRFTDQGWNNDDLKALGEELQPGHSAIIALVEDRWVAQASMAMAGYESLRTIALDANIAGAIASAGDDETGATAETVAVRGVNNATGEAFAVVSEVLDDPVSGITESTIIAAVVGPEEATDAVPETTDK